MKSKLTSKVRPLYGIGDVVRPRSVTYSTTCHQWFCIGASARRVLPTICVQRCSVDWVGAHSSSVSEGQAASVFSILLEPRQTRVVCQCYIQLRFSETPNWIFPSPQPTSKRS